jgi:hypothetical protein
VQYYQCLQFAKNKTGGFDSRFLFLGINALDCGITRAHIADTLFLDSGLFCCQFASAHIVGWGIYARFFIKTVSWYEMCWLRTGKKQKPRRERIRAGTYALIL